jgi:hypothetical protein
MKQRPIKKKIGGMGRWGRGVGGEARDTATAARAGEKGIFSPVIR